MRHRELSDDTLYQELYMLYDDDTIRHHSKITADSTGSLASTISMAMHSSLGLYSDLLYSLTRTA